MHFSTIALVFVTACFATEIACGYKRMVRGPSADPLHFNGNSVDVYAYVDEVLKTTQQYIKEMLRDWSNDTQIPPLPLNYDNVNYNINSTFTYVGSTGNIKLNNNNASYTVAEDGRSMNFSAAALLPSLAFDIQYMLSLNSEYYVSTGTGKISNMVMYVSWSVVQDSQGLNYNGEFKFADPDTSDLIASVVRGLLKDYQLVEYELKRSMQESCGTPLYTVMGDILLEHLSEVNVNNYIQ